MQHTRHSPTVHTHSNTAKVHGMLKEQPVSKGALPNNTTCRQQSACKVQQHITGEWRAYTDPALPYAGSTYSLEYIWQQNTREIAPTSCKLYSTQPLSTTCPKPSTRPPGSMTNCGDAPEHPATATTVYRAHQTHTNSSSQIQKPCIQWWSTEHINVNTGHSIQLYVAWEHRAQWEKACWRHIRKTYTCRLGVYQQVLHFIVRITLSALELASGHTCRYSP